jgi:hypothetical protein
LFGFIVFPGIHGFELVVDGKFVQNAYGADSDYLYFYKNAGYAASYPVIQIQSAVNKNNKKVSCSPGIDPGGLYPCDIFG